MSQSDFPDEHGDRSERDYMIDVDRRHYKRDTDAEEIRKTFGVPPFWKLEQRLEDRQKPLPNCVRHTPDGEEWGHEGGTNMLAVGEKGSGKSTFGLWIATILMDANNEAVIWRASQQRSEWLPLKHWTHLYLPSSTDIAAMWRPEDMRKQNEGEPADLYDQVAGVHFYDDVRDLVDQLEPHQFHVVYPDPEFVGCNEVVSESTYAPYPVEFVPQSVADEPEDVTPLVHWWVAFCTARLEYGPYDWTTLIFDETADLLPDSARADRHDTYEKVEIMRRIMADSRKYYYSLFFLAHHEENLHSKIRRTIQWRVSMPDGTANPCQIHNHRPPVGFSKIPMKYDMLSRQPIGRALCWTETNWTRFSWPDYPDWLKDRNCWLKISTSQKDIPTHARVTEQQREPEVADD